MGGVADGKVLAFGGVEVQLPIFGLDSAAVKGILENIVAASGARLKILLTIVGVTLIKPSYMSCNPALPRHKQ